MMWVGGYAVAKKSTIISRQAPVVARPVIA